MVLDANFGPLLQGMSVGALDSDPATIVGWWAGGRIGYFNTAYERFAIAGGEAALCTRWGLGANVLDALPEGLRPFYEDLFRRALVADAPITHRYECPSPELARTYAMTLYPLGDRQGLLASHVLAFSREHPDVMAADDRRYRNANGIVRQCAHCRKVRRVGDAAIWDLVPEYVAKPPAETSHGVCELCMEYHYGALE